PRCSLRSFAASLSVAVAVKAIVFPSGDQAKLLTLLSDLVSCTASPPSGEMAKTWLLSPTRSLGKATHRPSGDHCVLPAYLAPRVSCTALPVAVSASQRWVTKASCSKSVCVTP